MPKSASFDVIGTCFDFTHAINTITTRLGPKLTPHAIDPKTLFFSWFYAAQRDFTYLSLSDAYQPIATVLKSTFRRACAIVDLPPSDITDADVDAIITSFKDLQARAGLKECFDGLRSAGWDVYAVTNGGVETSLRYFQRAGVELDGEHLLSCDGLKVAKPDLRVYENANAWLRGRGCGGDGERWFVAAHAWDLIAARKAGFRTAYLGFEEHDSVAELFGRFDLYARDMRDLLEQLRNVR